MSSTSSSVCTGVAGLMTTAGSHPCDAIRCSVRFRCTQASWCTEIQLAPASANAPMKSSGFSIIKWQSKGTLAMVFRSEATTGGPIVKFGTKWPSITSRCRTVPPPSMAASASAPSCAKLAERMDGASSIKARSSRSSLGFRIAAIARWNGIAVRTSFRVAEETANALVQLGTDDVLEFAGLVARFGIVDRERVFEQALRETMTADHVARAAAAHSGQFDFAVTQIDQMQIRHAAENAPGRLLGQHRKMPGGSSGMKALDLGRLAFFAANPDLLEQMIEADFVVTGNGAAIGGVGQRAGERVARAVQRGIEMQAAMSKFDAAVGLARDVRVVRDHENGVAAAVQFAENFEDHGFVGFIEIAGGLVGQN